jgi:hypothetical protein
MIDKLSLMDSYVLTIILLSPCSMHCTKCFRLLLPPVYRLALFFCCAFFPALPTGRGACP